MSYRFNFSTGKLDLVETPYLPKIAVLEEFAIGTDEQNAVWQPVRVAAKLSVRGSLAIKGNYFDGAAERVAENSIFTSREPCSLRFLKNSGTIRVRERVKIGEFRGYDLSVCFISESEQFRINPGKLGLSFGKLTNKGSIKVLGRLLVK